MVPNDEGDFSWFSFRFLNEGRQTNIVKHSVHAVRLYIPYDS